MMEWTIPLTSLVIVVSADSVLTCGQTDRQTDTDERLTTMTLVGSTHLCYAAAVHPTAVSILTVMLTATAGKETASSA